MQCTGIPASICDLTMQPSGEKNIPRRSGSAQTRCWLGAPVASDPRTLEVAGDSSPLHADFPRPIHPIGRPIVLTIAKSDTSSGKVGHSYAKSDSTSPRASRGTLMCSRTYASRTLNSRTDGRPAVLTRSRGRARSLSCAGVSCAASAPLARSLAGHTATRQSSADVGWD